MASLGLFPFPLRAGETIRLHDFSYDPGGIGIAVRSWDFGDGATVAEPNPDHRYAEHGEYVVTLTVTTVDGRTASISQPLEVQEST